MKLLEKYKLIALEDLKVSPSRLLFFEAAFHELNSACRPIIVADKTKPLDAVFQYFVEDESINTSKSISFGGFDFSVQYSERSEFVERIICFLNEKYPNQKIRHISAPQVYFDYVQDVDAVCKVRAEELLQWKNHYLKVTSSSLSSQWNYSDLKKLRKCERSKFHSKKLDLKYLKQAYDVIATGWQSKGFIPSMTFDKLNLVAERYPNDYMLYASFDGMEIIASAIVIRITAKIWYVFYLGFLPEYHLYSPNRFLMNYIYQKAQEHQVDIIDMGTSINEGVSAFKERLGCEVCEKNKFLL